MGKNDNTITAQHILKLIEDGHIKAMTVEKSAINIDYIARLKKSGWRLLRTDVLGKKFKFYFARE